MTSVGGRRELFMKMLSSGSSGNLLLRQIFKADDSLHSGKPTDHRCEERTETDDSTTGRGADV